MGRNGSDIQINFKVVGNPEADSTYCSDPLTAEALLIAIEQDLGSVAAGGVTIKKVPEA